MGTKRMRFLKKIKMHTSFLVSASSYYYFIQHIGQFISYFEMRFF